MHALHALDACTTSVINILQLQIQANATCIPEQAESITSRKIYASVLCTLSSSHCTAVCAKLQILALALAFSVFERFMWSACASF